MHAYLVKTSCLSSVILTILQAGYFLSIFICLTLLRSLVIPTTLSAYRCWIMQFS